MNPDFSNGAIECISNIVLSNTDVDILKYKKSFLERRLTARMRARSCPSAARYLEVIDADSDEIRQLLNLLTINVTHFFRNPSTFEAIKEAVLPAIFDENAKRENFTIRIWSLGCASGEEPYSLAMILREYFSEDLGKFSLSITATDLDRNMIVKANEGLYGKKSLKNLPPSMTEKYFTKEDDKTYRLSDRIKEMVTFKHKDILDDIIIPGQDLILCRNILIYFPSNQQEIILNKLSTSLREGGFLILGKVEALMYKSRNLFKVKSPKERIYRKPS